MAGKNTVARLLGQHKAAILRDLDVNRVLPRLIKNDVISPSEEKHIIESGDRKRQCEVFLDILTKKGVGAFHEFCASLEESAPHLLTGFLLENPEAITDEKGPTKALQLGYELALKERDHALRQLQQIKTERDSALASLENLSGKPAKGSSSKSTDSSADPRSKSPSRKTSKTMESDTEIDEGLRRNSSVRKNKGGDTIIWETHKVTLNRVPGFGFGIAVSGGVDNPHFANGDPSIAISDVLKAGPAEGRLQINDRVISVNNYSLENVDHRTAIQVLKDSGNKVSLVIRRRVIVPSVMDPETPLKITLEKRNKKDDFGVVLGCKFFIKEIYHGSLAREDGNLMEEDTVLKINNTPIENLSLMEARKLIEKTKDKLQLFVTKKNLEDKYRRQNSRPQDDEASLGYGTLQGTLQTQKSDIDNVNIYRPNGPLDDVYKGSPQDIPRGAYPPSEHARYDGRYIYDHEGPPVPPLPTGVDPNAPPRPPSPGKEPLRPDDFYNSPQHNDGYYSDRPESHMDTAPMRRHHHDERYVGKRKDIVLEPRMVFFQKQPQVGLGLRLAGGNATGIFIASVQPGSGADDVGLTEGDEILIANGREIRGLSREEAVTYLTSLEGQVQMQVQYKNEEYERIMVSKEAGDSFYVRAHFAHEPTEQGELSINHGDVFLVKDTLFRGSVGSWLAVSIGKNNKENKKGIIPNKTRADELMGSQQSSEADKENTPTKGARGLFRRKTARRSKSLGKDHWEDVIFSNLTTKFPSYEKVIFNGVNFIRPVVVFGALSDVAREKMLMQFPDRFESPQHDNRGLDEDKKNKSGIIRLGAIKEIINRGKHCLLDVTPNNVDKLNYAQYYPIVIYLKAENKNVVKDSRAKLAKGSSKNPKKLYEQSVKLEKMYSHLFTATILQNTTEIWFQHVLEAIDIQQRQRIWMSEVQPEDNVHDDYLFPMASRLSFAGPRESEQDLTRHNDEFEYSPKHRQRLVRSSSDPSVNTMEKIPGIPPYPAPPSYRKPSSPTSPSGSGMYDDRRYVDLDRSEDRYYPSYYADNLSSRHHSRSHIDPYATITPHERLRPRLPEDDRWYDSQGHMSPPDHRRTDSDPARHSRPFHESQPQHHPMSPENKPYNDASSFSGDSYTRYTSHPANKHDDSKLREKFGTKGTRNTSHDPYRFTRSTAHPVNTSGVDKTKLSDLTARYRKDEPNQKPRSLSTSRLPASPHQPSNSMDQPQKKVPPPVPVKTYNLKERGIEPDELKIRNYENTNNRSYNYSDGNYATVHKPDRFQGDENPYDYVAPRTSFQRQQPPPSSHQSHYAKPFTGSSAPPPRGHNPGRYFENQIYMDTKELKSIQNQSQNDHHGNQDYYSRDPGYVSPGDKPRTDEELDRVKRVEYRKSWTGSDRQTKALSAYAKLVTPGFYGAHSKSQEEIRGGNQDLNDSDDRGSAFEAYRKPQLSTFGKADPSQSPAATTNGPLKNYSSRKQINGKHSPEPKSSGEGTTNQNALQLPVESCDQVETPSESEPPSEIVVSGFNNDHHLDENHTVVATARGTFDHTGGILESPETGVSIVIPAGAIPEGVQQEIYFKVCRDNNILPPLDREKGETLLSPLVMCGPHGLKFLQAVELQLPHCASVNPESWSFALKSSDSPSGQPTQWQNMNLAGTEGVSQGRVGKSKVSVLVDHF